MTVTATWINGPSGTPAYDARALRLGDSLFAEQSFTLGQSRSGVRRGNGNEFRVTVSGTTITVDQGSGFVNVPTGYHGGYVVASNASTIFTATRDGTNSRIGTVYLQVWDTDVDGFGFRKVEILYNQGTPAGTPTAPSIPTLAIRLADVTVPPSGSLIVTDKREWLTSLGGVKYVASGNPPETLAGQIWYQANEQRWLGSNGTDHFVLADPNPDWNALSGGNYTGNFTSMPSHALQYRIDKGRVYWRGRLAKDNGATLLAPGSYNPTFVLPGTTIPGRETMFACAASGGFGRLEFTPTGDVVMYISNASNWIDLATVQYDLVA